MDGQVGAVNARLPSAPHVLPSADAAGPDVAATVVLACHTNQSGAGHAAATVGGLGRVLEAIGRATAAGTTTGLTPSACGVRQGRPSRRPLPRRERPRAPGSVGVPTMGQAEATTVGLMYLHGPLLPETSGLRAVTPATGVAVDTPFP